MDFKLIGRHLLQVFRDWRFSLLAVLTAFLFYTMHALLLNYRAFGSAFSTHGWGAFLFFWNLIIGYKQVIALHSFVTLILLSILFGIFVSLILYKTLHFSKRHHPGVLGSIGVFLAVFAPGCAVCGIGLFSLFGLSSAFVTLLPWHGLELSILAIFILMYAILRFARDLNTCKL